MYLYAKGIDFAFLKLFNNRSNLHKPVYPIYLYHLIYSRCMICQQLAPGALFSPGTPVSSTNKTDCHNTTKISLKVELNIITLTQILWDLCVSVTRVIQIPTSPDKNFSTILHDKVVKSLNPPYFTDKPNQILHKLNVVGINPIFKKCVCSVSLFQMAQRKKTKEQTTIYKSLHYF